MNANSIISMIIACITLLLTGGGYAIFKFLEKNNIHVLDEDCLLTGNCSQNESVNPCTNRTCGLNEGCQVLNNHTSFCRCLPYFSRQDVTQECIYQYGWVEFTNKLMNEERLVKNEKESSVTDDLFYVIARVIYGNGNKIPCGSRINRNNGKILTALPLDKNDDNIQVLVAEPGRYEWISSPKVLEEYNAIEGGNIGNETVYVCRMNDLRNHVVGSMQPSTGLCARNSFFKKTYELLVLRNE